VIALDGVLQSPFPVFDNWIRFGEDELFDGAHFATSGPRNSNRHADETR